MSNFKKSSKKQCKLRLLLTGASGSGKTYSALTLATALTPGSVGVIDTENGSSNLYGARFEFDVANLYAPFEPESYIQLIKEAEQKYETIIIDSISHEWNGRGGCLEIQEKLGGRYQDWAKVTPRHIDFFNAIIYSKANIIATARSKEEHELDTSGGKVKVVKLGTKSIQREGYAYEFTSVLLLNENNFASSTKDRTGIFQGRDFVITEKTASEIKLWLNSGESEESIKLKLLENLDRYASLGVEDFKSYCRSLPNPDKKVIAKEINAIWDKIKPQEIEHNEENK